MLAAPQVCCLLTPCLCQPNWSLRQSKTMIGSGTPHSTVRSVGIGLSAHGSKDGEMSEKTLPPCPTGEVIVYETPDGETRVDVRIDKETVWLTQRQMARVFDTSIDNVGRHLRNVYSLSELEERATAEDFSVVQTEGRRRVRRNLKHYNLDVIISIGYRVNSRRGVGFRQWATRTLRDHLERGFTANERRLAERGLHEARQTLDLLTRTLRNRTLVDDTGESVLELIAGYVDTWRLLLEYDEDRLTTPAGTRPFESALDHAGSTGAIASFKRDLEARGEASPLFGNPRGDMLQGILGNIEQTMFGYPRGTGGAPALLHRQGPSLHRRQQAYRCTAIPALPQAGRGRASSQPTGPDRTDPPDRPKRAPRQGSHDPSHHQSACRTRRLIPAPRPYGCTAHDQGVSATHRQGQG